MKETILLIEDDKIMRITPRRLTQEGREELNALFESGTEALTALACNSFDTVVTDVRLPDIDGFDIVKGNNPKERYSGDRHDRVGTIKDAVEAMKLGAFMYITEPFALDEFLLMIERTLSGEETKRRKCEAQKGPQQMLFRSPT